MKKAIIVLVAVFVLLSAGALPGYAYVRWNIGITVPIWGPWWGYPAYPYPYYSSPPAVIQQQPAYGGQAPQGGGQPYYWYYCPDARTYYPYVKQCPGGWLKVVPTPAPPR